MCKSTADSDLLDHEQMCELIRAKKEEAGSLGALCQKLRMKSSAPVHLALQGEREISDGVSLHFGYERIYMYRRIGNASRT